MGKAEIAKLDKIYQQTLMEAYDNNSLLGGEAHLVHHYIPKSQGLAFRYYFPNGILLSTEQHNLIHSSDLRAKKIDNRICHLMGVEWRTDLIKRKNIIVKNLTYNKVLNYLNGLSNDYI